MELENTEKEAKNQWLQRNYPPDVHVFHAEGKEFILVGTAHISRNSADLVARVIEEEQPDCVCIELDQQRYETISHPNRWESLNIRDILKRRQMGTLVANLVLASYQKRLGAKLGVKPGTELLEAAIVADKFNIPIELCDRDVRVTLKRAWRSTSFFKKMTLMSSLFASIFDRTEISEEELEKIRQQDVLTEMLKELGESMPTLKRVLIDERDSYLAKKIHDAPGKRIVAVVGAGHVGGIEEAIMRGGTFANLEELEVVPPAGNTFKIIGWAIPLTIIAILIGIGIRQGGDVAQENAMWWILANAVPSGIGAFFAFGHPLTILASAIAAPITSLTPLIGAGYVGAFVQAFAKPPRVFEIQSVVDDVRSLKAWWKNRLLRIFLVLGMVSLGSAIGTYVGGAKIVSSFLKGAF